MHAAHPWRISLSLLFLAVLVPAEAAAKKPNPTMSLVYKPTTAVAEASAAPTSEMRAVPVAVLITDDRGLPDKAVVGSRSDDDDRREELKATNDLAGFVEAAVTQQARAWGFVVEEAAGAGVLLVGKITQFKIEETNQAVGATYGAEVTLDVELRDRAGKTQASGSYFGDASRYGKKFSADNANEVASDALAEALAKALGDPAVRTAWGGAPAPSAAGGAAPLSPEAALEELRGLMGQGAAESTLQDFLRGKTLTRALGADDVTAWKEAGVPEPVIRTAMTLRVK